MVDNVIADSGDGIGATFKTDDDGTAHWPYSKIAWGADNVQTRVSTGTSALPVQGAATENAAVAGNPVLSGGRYDATPRTLGDGDAGAIALAVDGAVHVDDGGNALTVDWAGTAPPIGAGVEATALRVTVATDSTGVLSVDDNGSTLSVDDGGGALTIDGTVTANLGATDNAVLDTIATNTGNTDTNTAPLLDLHSSDFDSGAGTDTTSSIGIAVAASGGAAVITGDTTNGLDVDVTRVSGTVTVDGSAVTQPVSAASLPLPSGAATAANQLADGHNVTVDNASGASAVNIQDGGNSITIDGTVTANAGTGAFNNASVATEGSALGSGVLLQGDDGTDRKNVAVDATTGNLQVEIAVDSVGIGGGTQYTEDDAAAANPVGTQPVMVRSDTPATIVSADGDVIGQRATNYGAAYVQILDSSGNYINTFGGSGGTSHADDAAFTIGSASSITPTGYLADETTPDSVDEGDVGVPRMTLTRKAYAVITDPTSENNAGVDASGHLQVDIAADSAGIGGGTQYTEDDAAAANPVVTMGGYVRLDSPTNLTTADGDVHALRGNNDGGLYVSLIGDDAGSPGTHKELHLQDTGTKNGLLNIPMDATGSQIVLTNQGLQIGGDEGHNSVDAGNPVKVGGRATNSVEGQTQVANADRSDILSDLNGVLITRPHTTLEEILSEQVSNTNGTSTAFTTFAAGGAGVHNYVTTIVVHNSSATDGYVDIRDGTAGSVLMTLPLPTTGGTVVNLPVPLKGSANTALAYDVSAALSTVYISVVGFQAQG
jgi:hypothetical protein